MRDRTGNLPPLSGIFPDYAAPIVRNQPGGRELMMARWGMPSPVIALRGKKSDPGVTNVRNVKSPHWRRWLGVESRCVVPFTSFSEIIWTSGIVLNDSGEGRRTCRLSGPERHIGSR
jgi:putative SOS response-associated peptidase YedK